ncbi:thioredoxin domain-containing protein [Thermodesulfobacteriota bacterium]
MKNSQQGKSGKNIQKQPVKSRTSESRTLPGGYRALFLIAVIGFLDASYLYRVHLSASKTCVVGDGCSVVLASTWATIAGIPVAALGAGMYLALAWFALQVLCKRETLPVNEPWMFIISALGVGISALFTALQAWVIRQWCPFCLLSAGLATAFFLICLLGGLKTGSLRGVIKQPELLYRGLPWALLAFVLPPLIVLAADQGRRDVDTGDTVSSGRVIGIIGAKKYTLADVDRAIRGKLQQLEEQRYQTRKAFLDEKLIALEASRQGLTPQTLIQKEVIDNISVKSDEVRQFIRENQSKLPNKISPALTRRIEKRVRHKKAAAARVDYVKRLKEKYGAKFSLPMPERLAIDANPRGGPVMGPADAPVTLIVFTDFECPFCRKTHQELHALMDRFPGKIRLALRHFPLAQHKWAGQAAEFAYCAQQQGRFWPFADSVFAHRGRLSEEILHAYTRQSGIADTEAFNQCVRTGQGKKAVADDIAEGKNLGVQSTPSLFINGRFFSGMPKDIDAVIQEEIDNWKDMG